MEDGMGRVLDRLESIAASVAAVREELAEMRGWSRRVDADVSSELRDIHEIIQRHDDTIGDLSRWRDRATGLVIGAQTVGMALTGVLVKLLTHLGFF